MRSASSLDIHVVPGAGVPIYRQIMAGVSDAVAAGRLSPGDRLPSQRELAQQLVVAPLTVKKAYDLLEQQGVVATRHGSGTFVAEGATTDAAGARVRLGRTARQLVAGAWLAGLDDDALIALVREAAARLRAERHGSGARNKTTNTTDDQEKTP